jgi:GT2 family glycosyltransferase
VILNKQNLSCGAAWNQGILSRQTEWTIVMNNDIIVAPNFVERLINFGRMLYQAIHLNIYTDKNGNEFIQARSSILTDDGRIMANAYIGSPKVYKGGINDEEANMRGRKALYKKIRKYFIDE